MFNLMREHHKKITSLNNLAPWTENNKELKQEVLSNGGDIYNELYYIYKNKYRWLSVPVWRRTRRNNNWYEFNKYIAEEEIDINNELFTKHLNYHRPSDILKHL